MKPRAGKTQGEEGLRQSMSWLHTWSGLIFGWILFAMFLTGTLSFFQHEITHWMQPEIQMRPAPAQASASAALAQRYLTEHAPDAKLWIIRLPSDRKPVILLFYKKPGERRYARVELDPHTGQVIKGRKTRGGDFFYRFHFELEMAHPGRWLVGIAAMFMLAAIVSGIITHKKIFTDFFTFRPKKGGQRAWMDGHNALSVLGLPFHLMITFSGLLLLAYMLMPAGILAAYDNPNQFGDEANPAYKVAAPRRQPASLTAFAPLVEQAQQRWHGGVEDISVNHPGDVGATVTITRSVADGVSYGQIAPYLRFDGVSGALLEGRDAASPAIRTAGVIGGLHLARFAAPLLRWLYFLVGLVGTGMIGSGLVLWIAKRRQKARPGAREAFSLRLVDGLNAGIIAGLFIAMAAFFWANRLLPADLPSRSAWEVRAFFGAWGLSLGYAFLFHSRKWRDLLALAAASLALVPVLNALTTSRHLGVSLPTGDWVMAGFDLTCLAGALLLGWMARKAARARKMSSKAAAKASARPLAQALIQVPVQAPASNHASAAPPHPPAEARL